jgi:hypothetical protein
MILDVNKIKPKRSFTNPREVIVTSAFHSQSIQFEFRLEPCHIKRGF